MTDPQLTEIVVVLDRSGSMESIRTPMIEGFDAFIREQKAAPGKGVVSLFIFDDEWERVYEEVPLGEVRSLELRPRNWTALYDALAFTIIAVGNRLSVKPEGERPGKVVVLVITDGMDNRSKLYNARSVGELMEQQRKLYDWQFAFLGANVDAKKEAGAMGMSATQAMNFQANPRDVARAYGAVGQAVSSYRTNVSSSLNFVAPDEEEQIP